MPAGTRLKTGSPRTARVAAPRGRSKPQPPLGRWGEGTRADALDARARVLEAAIRCYERTGFKDTVMEDIAAEAQIARRTLYRHFRSHREVFAAVLGRERQRFWHEVQHELLGRPMADFGEFLVEAMIYTIKHAPESDRFGFLFDPNVLSIANEIYIANRQHLVDLAAIWRPIYERLEGHRAGKRDAVDLILLCEWFNRIAVSYLATPSPFYRTERQLRALFRATLLPVVRQHRP